MPNNGVKAMVKAKAGNKEQEKQTTMKQSSVADVRATQKADGKVQGL